MSAFLSMLLLLAASGEARLAVTGSAAVLHPLVEPAARCSANPQLVIAIIGFTPPHEGASSLIVSVRTRDGRTMRLGDIGIFPNQPFSASLAQARRFGFAIPPRFVSPETNVTVEVAPDGNGAGARAVVGEARITPAPQERCTAIRP